ncbi:amino acid adenylation domain-containing protein [Croceitalea marina]|uniref:Amino acid adenylation domain-containing protein n=1 Tax=Croceitalea marina TaxID=1775166 RepID=A0ABW5MVP0_9FLAO
MNKVPPQAKTNSTKDSKYWKEKLNNRLFTSIPRWHESDIKKQEEKGSLNIKISKELLIALKDLNKRLNTPLNTILLAAHCKVISVLSGNLDVLTGYKVNSDNDNQFQNIIPYRVKLRTGNWKEFIKKTEQEQKEVSVFKNHSILELENEISPLNELFETTFGFNDTKELTNKNSVAQQKLEEEREFPLQTTFSYQSENSLLNLNIIYNAAEFSHKQIEIISGYYISTLILMSKDENAAHELQSILSDEEKFKLLDQFNSNKVDFPIEKTFIDLFEEQVQKYPNSVSVKFGDNEWTYSDLNNQANKVANHLIKNNISIEDAVVVVMQRDHLWMACVLGIMKAGGVYVPVRPDWPESRKKTILQKTKAKFVITDDDNESNLFDIIKKDGNKSSLIKIDKLLENVTAEKNFVSSAKPDNLAYIIFTSGSTGEPKGAMIEHKGMLNHLFSKVNDLELVNTDIIAQNSSQSFDISVWQLISGLLVGAKTVIYSDDLILDIIGFLNEVKKDKITILELVPSYMKIVLQLSKPNSTAFDYIKYLLVTGEPLKIGLVNSWFNFFKKIPLVNAYGPTEASDDITHHFMYEAPKSAMVPVGTPIQNLNIYIVDSFDQLAPIGTKGQVYVSGVGVGRGYIGDSDKTKEVFTNDHLKPMEKLKLYKTGDIGSWTNEGILHLFGREDNQIKLNGYRIDLGEIEQCLSKQNGVSGNAVLLKNKQLHAFIVFENKDNQNQIEQCKSGLQEHLPHYMVPRRFHVLQNLPLTQNGKIDRKALEYTIPQQYKKS